MPDESRVESYLENLLAENEASDIAPTENRAIRTILANSAALGSLRKDLERQLPERAHHQAVIRMLVGFLAYELPEIQRAEDDRRRVADLSGEIIAKIEELAKALELRSRLCSRSEITIPDSYNPLDWIITAAGHDPYCRELHDSLALLRENTSEWPDQADALRAIIELESDYSPEHINNSNWVASTGNTSSYTPIIRALLYKQFKLIGKLPPRALTAIPEYRLTDTTNAALINALLPSSDGGISSDTAKKARQRLKKQVSIEAENDQPTDFISFLS